MFVTLDSFHIYVCFFFVLPYTVITSPQLISLTSTLIPPSHLHLLSDLIQLSLHTSVHTCIKSCNF